MTPSERRRVDRQLRLDLIEAAVRENEAELGRPGPEPAQRREPRRRPPRRFPAWSLLLLVPVAAAAGLGYLELKGPGTDIPPDPPVEAAPPESEVRFTEPPESLDLDVFPLPIRKIMLDPGHGGSASGAAAGGLAEKDLALDIAGRVRELLADRYRVAMTREADIDVELDRRSDIANQAEADLFVSIHVNWLARNQTCGVETYFLGPTDDPELTALAERENAEAHGYSLADLRRILDGVYAQAMQDESRTLADAVQAALVEGLRKSNPGLGNRGVKSAPFVVLIGAQMPAILAEVSCLSDADEIERLQDDLYLQSIAEALDAGIRNYADSHLHPFRPPAGDPALSSAPSESPGEP
ncbi:MAG: N-acetylmuramoyl-L-alanine amidase [Acidobacteria bacterium]|nr:N-acetylmuramoyl-L-alanine amidase [Acidobacteriota bacterium]